MAHYLQSKGKSKIKILMIKKPQLLLQAEIHHRIYIKSLSNNNPLYLKDLPINQTLNQNIKKCKKRLIKNNNINYKNKK